MHQFCAALDWCAVTDRIDGEENEQKWRTHVCWQDEHVSVKCLIKVYWRSVFSWYCRYQSWTMIHGLLVKLIDVRDIWSGTNRGETSIRRSIALHDWSVLTRVSVCCHVRWKHRLLIQQEIIVWPVTLGKRGVAIRYDLVSYPRENTHRPKETKLIRSGWTLSRSICENSSKTFLGQFCLL